jgi:hypothetical protein
LLAALTMGGLASAALGTAAPQSRLRKLPSQ